MQRGARHGERGVALVLVIWVLALLSVIGVTVAVGARTELRVARNRADAATLAAAADGGVWWAIDRLLAAKGPSLRRDGTPYQVVLGPHAIEIAVQDEGGKLDINTAPAGRLAALMRAVGFDGTEALDLAGAVEQYRLRVVPVGSDEQRSFPIVEQLRRVDGIDAERYARIAPFITVHSGAGEPIAALAPRAVLIATAGGDVRLAERQLAERAAARYDAPASGIVTIRVTSGKDDGARFVREAVVALDAAIDPPLRILAWRRGQP
jgi:general secretion pathway protein K